jgi:hypothetical protein
VALVPLLLLVGPVWKVLLLVLLLVLRALLPALHLHLWHLVRHLVLFPSVELRPIQGSGLLPRLLVKPPPTPWVKDLVRRGLVGRLAIGYRMPRPLILARVNTTSSVVTPLIALLREPE